MLAGVGSAVCDAGRWGQREQGGWKPQEIPGTHRQPKRTPQSRSGQEAGQGPQGSSLLTQYRCAECYSLCLGGSSPSHREGCCSQSVPQVHGACCSQCWSGSEGLRSG